MKKMVKKFTKILLLAVMVLSELMTPISVLADEITKSVPNKGDIGLNETITYDENGKNSVTVSAGAERNEDGTLSNDGDVSVTKTVSKTDINGRYKVEFNIKGEDVNKTTITTKPSYTVFVLDASGSMKGTPWKNAKSAAINFGNALLAKNTEDSIKNRIALVTFDKNGYSLRGFDNTSDFIDENFGTTGSGTNYELGLEGAYTYFNALTEKQKTESSLNIIFISDGKPNRGDYTNVLKNLKDLKVNIYSFAYNLDKDDDAYDVLAGISTDGNVTSVTSSNINNVLDSFVTSVTNTTKAAVKVTLTDNIGDEFKIVNADGTLSNDRSYTKTCANPEKICDAGLEEITTDGTTLTFYVQINPDAESEAWHKVNKGFYLNYTDYNGNATTITFGDGKDEDGNDRIEQDPEVYWKYDFIINYYKDEITNKEDDNYVGSETLNDVLNGYVVTESDVDKNYNGFPTEYEYNSVMPVSVTVDKLNNQVQEINVLYTKKKFNYKVNYYFADENNNYSTEADESIYMPNIEYGTTVNTSEHYKDNIEETYTLDEVKTVEKEYTIIDNDVVINIYYKRKSYEYTVNYHFNNVIDNYFTKNNNALFGSIIKAEDNYLENNTEDNAKLENKEQKDNKDYFLHPTLESNKESITIGTGNNALNLYYISTMVKEDNVKDITKTASIETLTSGNTPVTYNIDYKNILLNVRKDSTVKVIIEDILPHEIDVTKSNLKSGINNVEGVVSNNNKKITWTFETTIDEFKEELDVSKNFNYTVVYKDVANVSSNKDNTLINIANGTVFVNNRLIVTDRDTASVTVNVKGNLVVKHLEKGTLNILAETENYTGIVGTNYSTNYKTDILGYTVDTTNMPNNVNGTYSEEDTEVIYYYVRKNGEINNPTIDKKGPEKVEDVNSTFEYKITASGTVKDYVGKVTLKVTDTLPYEIDEENSVLDNSCKYKNGVIACIKEYNITSEDYTTLEDGEKVFNINEEFILNLKYKNITSETVTNNAKSEIILDKVTEGKEDESETKVEKGKVTAIYVEEGNENNVLADSETTEGLVGNSYTTKEKEIFGYTLVELPENKEGKYTKEDITVKYVYSKNIGTSKEELEKVGTTNIKDINSKFDYTIKYNTIIMDYVGEAKLVIKDILPYEIDTEKSKYSNNCKYINGEIVCTYNKKITKEDNTFIIEEEFELYYINVNKKDVLNRVESVLTYGESEKINNDEFVSTVKEGTVIVNYVTKENGKYIGLADSITLTGPVGTNYTTEKKEFDKYNFIEVIGETNGEYTDGEIEVTYVYDLTPLPPQTGVETNPFMIMQYIISAFLLFIINRIYKTLKNN